MERIGSHIYADKNHPSPSDLGVGMFLSTNFMLYSPIGLQKYL